ncbi:MAG: hypothetical protein PHX58_13515 [Desulfovibrio sp.]|nr:hypothetical protein [Desulfovibrio sp.]
MRNLVFLRPPGYVDFPAFSQFRPAVMGFAQMINRKPVRAAPRMFCNPVRILLRGHYRSLCGARSNQIMNTW